MAYTQSWGWMGEKSTDRWLAAPQLRQSQSRDCGCEVSFLGLAEIHTPFNRRSALPTLAVNTGDRTNNIIFSLKSQKGNPFKWSFVKYQA